MSKLSRFAKSKPVRSRKKHNEGCSDDDDFREATSSKYKFQTEVVSPKPSDSVAVSFSEYFQLNSNGQKLEQSASDFPRKNTSEDDAKSPPPAENDSSGLFSGTNIVCPFCWKPLTDKLVSTTHIKSCAKGMSTEKIFEAMSLHEKQIKEWQGLGIKYPGFKPTKSTKGNARGKGTKPKAPKRRDQADLELALALSASLHEEMENRKEKEERLPSDCEVKDFETARCNKSDNIEKKKSCRVRLVKGSRGKRHIKIDEKPTPLFLATDEDRKSNISEKICSILEKQQEDVDEIVLAKDPVVKQLVESSHLPERLKKFQSETTSLWRLSQIKNGDSNDITGKDSSDPCGLNTSSVKSLQPEKLHIEAGSIRDPSTDVLSNDNKSTYRLSISIQNFPKISPVLDDIFQLFLKQKDTDVFIKTSNGVVIGCHRFMLSARCCSLLNTGIREAHGLTVFLENCDKVVETFLSYVYTDHFPHEQDQSVISEAISLCKKFNIKFETKLCQSEFVLHQSTQTDISMELPPDQSNRVRDDFEQLLQEKKDHDCDFNVSDIEEEESNCSLDIFESHDNTNEYHGSSDGSVKQDKINAQANSLNKESRIHLDRVENDSANTIIRLECANDKPVQNSTADSTLRKRHRSESDLSRTSEKFNVSEIVGLLITDEKDGKLLNSEHIVGSDTALSAGKTKANKKLKIESDCDIDGIYCDNDVFSGSGSDIIFSDESVVTEKTKCFETNSSKAKIDCLWDFNSGQVGTSKSGWKDEDKNISWTCKSPVEPEMKDTGIWRDDSCFEKMYVLEQVDDGEGTKKTSNADLLQEQIQNSSVIDTSKKNKGRGRSKCSVKFPKATKNSSKVKKDDVSQKEAPSKTKIMPFSQGDTKSPQVSSEMKNLNGSPCLNYSLIDTPILKRELNKYGLKPLPRSKAKRILRHIHAETHK